MANYKLYKRKQQAEIRSYKEGEKLTGVIVSEEEIKNGSPKKGDKVARNPENHSEKWLISEQHFNDNFELASPLQKKKRFNQNLLSDIVRLAKERRIELKALKALNVDNKNKRNYKKHLPQDSLSKIEGFSIGYKKALEDIVDRLILVVPTRLK